MVEWHETNEAYLLVMIRPHPVVDLYDYVTKHKRIKEALARYRAAKAVVLKFFLIFRLCGSQRFFFIIHGPLFLSINFHAKSSKEQKKSRPQMYQSSTIQWDNLSQIRDLLAVPLKLLYGPQGKCGPQFENH